MNDRWDWEEDEVMNDRPLRIKVKHGHCRHCGLKMQKGYYSLHESLCAENPNKYTGTCQHGYPQTVRCSRCGE